MSHTRNERIYSNLDVFTESQYTNPGRTIAGSINPEVLVPSPANEGPSRRGKATDEAAYGRDQSPSRVRARRSTTAAKPSRIITSRGTGAPR